MKYRIGLDLGGTKVLGVVTDSSFNVVHRKKHRLSNRADILAVMDQIADVYRELANNVMDHRLTTRSVKLNPLLNFLCWNMEYHLEHHMFPMVPAYNLKKLHNAVKDQILIKHLRLQLPKKEKMAKKFSILISLVDHNDNEGRFLLPKGKEKV